MGANNKLPLPPGAPTEDDVKAFLGEALVQHQEDQRDKWHLRDWTQACVCAYMGLANGVCAGAARVSRGTFQVWLRELPILAECLEHFRTQGIQLLSGRLWGFSNDDAQTTRWMAERVDRESYAPPVKRTEITGSDEGPVRVELVDQDAQADSVEVPKEISGEEEEDEGS